jgi:hypothetical protein
MEQTRLMFAGDRHLMKLCKLTFVASTSYKRTIAMAVIINNGGSDGSGGYTFLGLILGAVLLAVGVGGFLMWDNYKSGGAPKAIVITGQTK